MYQKKIARTMLNDLEKFIHENYTGDLPNSLLIAQTFMLKFSDYGNDVDLSAILDAVDYVLINR
jgi:hypothetical protein